MSANPGGGMTADEFETAKEGLMRSIAQSMKTVKRRAGYRLREFVGAFPEVEFIRIGRSWTTVDLEPEYGEMIRPELLGPWSDRTIRWLGGREHLVVLEMDEDGEPLRVRFNL